MKNLSSKALVICFFALFALVTSFTSEAISEASVSSVNAADKYAVCHNGQTIFVNWGLLKQHIKHGDYPGECVQQPTLAQ